LESTGVWVSDVPLDESEGAKGHDVLQVELNVEPSTLESYEIIKDGKPYREWCMPAAMLNAGHIGRWEDKE
jgi:hypothetical protein